MTELQKNIMQPSGESRNNSKTRSFCHIFQFENKLRTDASKGIWSDDILQSGNPVYYAFGTLNSAEKIVRT